MQIHHFEKCVDVGKSYRSSPRGSRFLSFLLEMLRADVLYKTYKSERNRRTHEKVTSKFRVTFFVTCHGRLENHHFDRSMYRAANETESPGREHDGGRSHLTIRSLYTDFRQQSDF